MAPSSRADARRRAQAMPKGRGGAPTPDQGAGRSKSPSRGRGKAPANQSFTDSPVGCIIEEDGSARRARGFQVLGYG